MKIYITKDTDGRVSVHDAPPSLDAQGMWWCDGCTDDLSDILFSIFGGIIDRLVENHVVLPGKCVTWDITAEWRQFDNGEDTPLIPACAKNDDDSDDYGDPSLDPLNTWKQAVEEEGWFGD